LFGEKKGPYFSCHQAPAIQAVMTNPMMVSRPKYKGALLEKTDDRLFLHQRLSGLEVDNGGTEPALGVDAEAHLETRPWVARQVWRIEATQRGILPVQLHHNGPFGAVGFLPVETPVRVPEVTVLTQGLPQFADHKLELALRFPECTGRHKL